MKPVKQDRLYSPEGLGNGNCFAACLASLLEIPLWMVPPWEEMFARNWRPRVDEWLLVLGWFIIRADGHPQDDMPEFYIANGLSPRNVFHSVIYSAGKLVHDPHPIGGDIAEVEYVYYLARVE